ncbi:glucose 1-dehydrogenase [candidate division WOR-3 bacterium]|uniref:Glucose 1-dehydrogenase n=1 Tax=candidate division WOR-3 bacterium TaxID=2052148 RepID=A0A9D5QEU1_UNCW3|nr:glucose 1-dehydrogenase [candidate division WOR-3 bacterium]MBD3365355.1 glucose 1-dehydrogenase [candidate division WOR-3 bacterium]
MKRLLEEKVILITGGSSGIGRAAAILAAREGAKVLVSADKNIEGGQETVSAIKKEGGEGAFVQADVSHFVDVQRMVNRTVELYGRLDCAFNNAGIYGERKPIIDYPDNAFDRVIAVNLKGVWLCMKAEIPLMIEKDRGVIVNTASVGGLTSWENASGYITSKHAVVGLTRSAALEYSRRGIRINALCPGVTRTSMFSGRGDPDKETQAASWHAMNRIGKPEEVAESVVWLCSDKASFVTGHCFTVDGGYTTGGR